jgi:predicted transposase YdaD
VFAELTNRQEVWRRALEDWDMKESQLVKEWEDKARREGEAKGKAEGEAKGKAEGKAEALLQFLSRRFKAVPDELRTAILAAPEERLTAWLDVAFAARSLPRFRDQAGL